MKLIKENETFKWIGEGVPIQRRRNRIRYEAFSLGKLNIGIGEFVLVRNDDALEPEDAMSCFVAQVKDLFDTGSEFDPYQAEVQWFSRVLELPSYTIKSLKGVCHEFEVVLDKRSSWHNMIDAETIFQKCEVIFLASDADFESAFSKYNDYPIPVFFCRYTFTGTSLIEVKDLDKHIIHKPIRSKSVANENCHTNGSVSHSDEVQNNSTPVKIKNGSIMESDNMYCAIPIGTPSKCPKVLIKRIDDKILESRNGNVRIFVADSNVEKVEDVADIFLNKLKLEKDKQYSGNLKEKPTIHSLAPQNISEQNETLSTPKNRKNYIRNKATPLNNKSCKNLFSENSRSSPRKNTPQKNSDVHSTPTKKFRIETPDDLCLSSGRKIKFISSDEESDVEISKNLTSDKKKQPLIHAFNSQNNNSVNMKCKINKELISGSEEESKKSVTPKTKKSSVNKKNSTPLNSRSSKKITIVDKKESASNNTDCESDTYSTPKKKAKFTGVLDNFCLTRSGRRVKAINYFEYGNETKAFISTATPTKTKLPRFIRTDCSEDSDSSNFSGGEESSDDNSLSDVSLLDELSPSKTKKLTKNNKRASTKSSKNVGIQTPRVKKNIVNFSIPERKTPFKTPKNALEESRQRLHVSAVPNSLPCRDEEYSDIYSFVKGCLCAQTGGCMYISGVPGTGKTATVHEVIRNLEDEKELGEVPIFSFVEVNGMWMTDPYQCYVQIFKALTGKNIAPQQAADLLEKRFTERGPKKDAVVLLVDELDRLWTRKQTVMYNIFDWPTKKNSKLIVLAIANTMDLPERMMMNRISSRLGLTRKTFQPYTFKQLQEIIMSRIQELKVFDPDAVQLVARKVAAVSGDARRALDICRFATEAVKIGQTTKKGHKILVGMEHVDTALQQMFSSPVISAIRSSSRVAKLFFQCILSEFTRSGLEETTLLKVYHQVVSVCRFEGLCPPTSTEISRISADLAASHLILVDNFKNDLYMKIRLNVSSDDVTYALTLK